MAMRINKITPVYWAVPMCQAVTALKYTYKYFHIFMNIHRF